MSITCWRICSPNRFASSGSLVQAVSKSLIRLAESRELWIEAALLERRHHVIDERRHPAATRDEPFTDDVNVVDVEMRQVGNQRVRRIVG
jgi:hypothetical protein